MSSLFSGSKAPAAPTVATTYTAAPARSDAEVQADMSTDRQRRAAMSGRNSTILTGGADTVAQTAQKTLLGG